MTNVTAVEATDDNKPTPPPFWADRAFWLIVVGIAAPFVLKFFGIQLNAEVVAADAALILGYVAAHKAKTGAALKAEITAWALARYTRKVATAPTTPVAVAPALDRPVV